MTAQLDIQRVDVDGGAVVLVVRGEIDIASVAELESALDLALADRHLVLDLTEVTFVDSTGLRAFIIANDLAVARGGRLTLAASPGPVRRLLDITGVGENLSTTESVEAALGPD